MSSYLSKSKKGFKPKTSVRRAAAPQTSSSQTSTRGSVERRTQTPQPVPAHTSQNDIRKGNPERSIATNGNVPSHAHNGHSSTHPVQLDRLASYVPEEANRIEKATQATPSSQQNAARGVLGKPSVQPTAPTGTSVNVEGDAPIRPTIDNALLNLPSLPELRLQSQSQCTGSGITSGDSQETQPIDQVGSAINYSNELQEESTCSTAFHVQTSASNQKDGGHRDAITKLPASTRVRSRQVEVDQSQTQPAGAEGDSPQAQKPKRMLRVNKRKQRVGTDHGSVGSPARHAEGSEEEVNHERRRRKRRRRETTPEDADIAEITPSEVTMSELTRDTRLGKKSDREIQLQERDKEEAARKQERARQELHSFMDNPENMNASNEGATSASVQSPAEGVVEEPEEPAVRLAPQVRLVNGQIVQDDESRMINRHVHADEDRESEVVVLENSLSRVVNAGSYLKRERHTKWTAEQNDLFFDGLRMFGTDFMMISKMFPGRTRRQIKLKFSKEERLDREYIKQVLLHERKEPNLEDFQQLSGEVYADPSGLERDLADDRRRLEEEQQREKEALEEVQRQRDEEVAAERAARGDSAKDQTAASNENEDRSENDGSVGSPPTKRKHSQGTIGRSKPKSTRDQARKKRKLRVLAPTEA